MGRSSPDIALPDRPQASLADAEVKRIAAIDLALAEGRLAEAGTLLSDGLQASPASLSLLRRGASLAARQGALGAAQTMLHRLLVADPDDYEAWRIAADLAAMSGDRSGRHEAFAEMLRLRPRDAAVLYGFVQSAKLAGELEAATARIARWVEAGPVDPMLLYAQGIAAEARGDYAAALDAFDAALAMSGDEVVDDLVERRALVLSRHQPGPDAEAALDAAILRSPNNPHLHQGLAALLIGQSRPAEALAAARRAQALVPANVHVETNIATCSVSIGLQDEALAAARRAVSINPRDVTAHRALLGALPYHPDVTGRAMREAAEAATLCYPADDGHGFGNDPDPSRPLTLGVVSGRFCGHPVGWLTIRGFENLDPSQFRVVGYDVSAKRQDMMTARFRTAFHQWRDVSRDSDAGVVDAIRADGCDLVIDLSGWGAGGRMHALNRRAAPVQLKWVGSQAHSTGMATMDWFVSDRWETPEGFEPFYTERLLRLDDGYVAFEFPAHAPPIVPAPCLAAGYVTFGCYNNLAKVTPRVLEAWSRILNALPSSRLVLRTHAFRTDEVRERTHGAFAARGVDPSRVDLLGPLPHEQFLASYGAIDIALDPFPYGGGLSTLEAMWMGVPTVALAGETFAGRHSVSHLSNAGLADWVADDVDAYVALAVERASDHAAIANLRTCLREQVSASPVCDGPRFGASLGRGLRHAWREWCRERGALS